MGKVCWPGLAWRILRFVQGTMDQSHRHELVVHQGAFNLFPETKDATCFKMHSLHSNAFLQFLFGFADVSVEIDANPKRN